MCRRTITYLRTTRLATLVPFDDSMRLHRAMAYVICAATVVHGGGQAFNYCMYYYALEPGVFGSTQARRPRIRPPPRAHSPPRHRACTACGTEKCVRVFVCLNAGALDGHHRYAAAIGHCTNGAPPNPVSPVAPFPA